MNVRCRTRCCDGARTTTEDAQMQLPVMPPISPMLAKNAAKLPAGGDWIFEPKWDGFRCLVFRDDDEVELGHATANRSTATSPSSRNRSVRSCRPAPSWTASWSCRPATA
jgi:ATP-dependent DNA ligase